MHAYEKWRDVLSLAPDEKTVRAVMRDYVKAIDPELLELMPPESQKVLDPAIDLQTAAIALLHCELAFRDSGEIAELLHEVAHTFAAASVRLSWLRTKGLLPVRP